MEGEMQATHESPAHLYISNGLDYGLCILGHH